jgi:hypothetical protein
VPACSTWKSAVEFRWRVFSYDNPSLSFRYSAKDAVHFGHALALAGLGLFGKERTNVTVLASGAGPERTKENIRHAFDRVANEAQGSDLLVVYLAEVNRRFFN